ncbi:hypothetical protein EUGRSUZ_A02539 [Eucalyptus grandis]|uniref:Uncharacterized protein n=2 Tax=Eucalyptus grandis TaxID=71139 RepID=A0ACC3M7V8_EUCGR|nr:hypothetical protein EUGRSUZ_A02539 [Eucalyptus grandis]
MTTSFSRLAGYFGGKKYIQERMAASSFCKLFANIHDGHEAFRDSSHELVQRLILTYVLKLGKEIGFHNRKMNFKLSLEALLSCCHHFKPGVAYFVIHTSGLIASCS